MTPLTQLIIESGYDSRPLTAHQVKRLVGGNEARRYGLVNRALKSGELLQVRRGLYLLDQKYRKHSLHPFVLAQQLMPWSYVTAESALSYHGWIPEAVHSVLSVTATAKSVTYEHELLGLFQFKRMTVQPGYFLQCVGRYELQQQVALIADPMRALIDMVYLRKLSWQGQGFLIDGLRIDEQMLNNVSKPGIARLLDVYKGKREKEFINNLLQE